MTVQITATHGYLAGPDPIMYRDFTLVGSDDDTYTYIKISFRLWLCCLLDSLRGRLNVYEFTVPTKFQTTCPLVDLLQNALR